MRLHFIKGPLMNEIVPFGDIVALSKRDTTCTTDFSDLYITHFKKGCDPCATRREAKASVNDCAIFCMWPLGYPPTLLVVVARSEARGLNQPPLQA